MTYEELQGQTRIEMSRRLQVLGNDISAWTGAPRLEAMGLSQAQRNALVDLMQVMQQRQNHAFTAMDQQQPAPKFADGQAELLLQMTGAQELWHVFRTILEQHEDDSTKIAVKTATRIAGDCYQFCIRRVRSWQAITPDKFREQPLVFMEAVETPATAGRQDRVRALSANIRQWRDVKLPLPIALLPFDYGQSIWTFCGLHHEVGHNIDQDLDLSTELRGSLLEILPVATEPHWRRWSAEILADVFGVMLGGAGFVLSMAALALTLGPANQFQDLDDEAVHPPLLLRLRLLIEMLKQTGVPGLAQHASELQTAWDGAAKPPWLTPFVDDSPKVAQHFLTRKLANLKDHALLELNTDLAPEHALLEQLANFFLTGKNRPVPSKDAGMHPRLVPSAAQLALRRAPNLSAEVLQQLQIEALKYIDLIPPVAQLAAPVVQAAERRQFLQQLARDIDFRKVGTAREEAR